VASAILAHVGMLRGTMTVDSYLGRASAKDVSLPPPPPELAREFDSAISRAIAISREQVARAPDDAQARYELGAALGLRASFMATVDGSVLAAMRAAREAFDAHEKVMALDARRADAGLVIGTYRYLVAVMPLPLRLLAYMVGFGGGREKGLEFVEKAAEYGGDNEADSRIALVLLYNREARYDAALGQLQGLRSRFPRNRLLWLEAGSTLLRADRPAEAEQMLDAGIEMLARDSRPRMLGEEALWFYRRGAARAALERYDEAERDLRRSIDANGRRWVQGRAHYELGRIAFMESHTEQARAHLQSAVRLGNSDRDGDSAERARELLARVERGR